MFFFKSCQHTKVESLTNESIINEVYLYREAHTRTISVIILYTNHKSFCQQYGDRYRGRELDRRHWDDRESYYGRDGGYRDGDDEDWRQSDNRIKEPSNIILLHGLPDELTREDVSCFWCKILCFYCSSEGGRCKKNTST